MEFVQGTKLSDVWLDLEERQVISLLRQLTRLESKMMSICFPAGGSPYYAQHLKTLARGSGIPLEDERFCVGPDARGMEGDHSSTMAGDHVRHFLPSCFLIPSLN